MDEREFYIFGLPVQTEFGEVRFLTYLEYLQNLADLSNMSQNVLHIYYQYRELYDKAKLKKDEKEQVEKNLTELKEQKLFDIVMSSEGYKESYKKIFNLVINNDEAVSLIMNHEELFMKFRKLVLDMNMLTESLVSPNEEIQKGIERSRRAKMASNKDKQTLGDIVSSIAVGAGISPEHVARMHVLLVYSIYYRIGKFQNYNTSTLFATVAEKVEIESWSAHVNMWEQETDSMEKSDFDKKFGGMF